MNRSAAYPLSRLQPVEGLPAKGVDVSLEATEDERAALAEILDILGIEGLRATFTVTPWRKGGAKVKGIVEAEVVQACVYTLEPVRQSVREEVELSFLPDAALPRPGQEVELEEQDLDLPEPLEDGAVDLGAIAAEHMALGLDPYPHAPGAVFEGYMEDPPGPEEGEPGPDSPFAKLAGLKGRQKP